MLIDSSVTCTEAELSLLDVRALIVVRVSRMREQLSAGVVETYMHPSCRSVFGPKCGSFVCGRSVDLRAVYEAGYLVHLFARAKFAARTDCSADEVEAGFLPVRVEGIVRRDQNREALRMRIPLNRTTLNHLSSLCGRGKFGQH